MIAFSDFSLHEFGPSPQDAEPVLLKQEEDEHDTDKKTQKYTARYKLPFIRTPLTIFGQDVSPLNNWRLGVNQNISPTFFDKPKIKDQSPNLRNKPSAMIREAQGNTPERKWAVEGRRAADKSCMLRDKALADTYI